MRKYVLQFDPAEWGSKGHAEREEVRAGFADFLASTRTAAFALPPGVTVAALEGPTEFNPWGESRLPLRACPR